LQQGEKGCDDSGERSERIPREEGGFALGIFFNGVKIFHLHQSRDDGLTGGGSRVTHAGERVVEGVLLVEVGENAEGRDVKHVAVEKKLAEGAEEVGDEEDTREQRPSGIPLGLPD